MPAAAETPQELVGCVATSRGLSLAPLLKEIAICQCLGCMCGGLQLSGITEIRNSLC